MNTVLCGMMGCGKTTVAEKLARLTGGRRVDTDERIVAEHGAIAEIFATYGEAYFRDLETAVTRQLSSEDGLIVSLGGGCVLRSENVENLKKNGAIFYLRTQPETLIERLRGDRTRPLLAGDVEERVKTILARRAPVYESVADHIVDTDGLSPVQIAETIRRIMYEDGSHYGRNQGHR